MTRADPAARPGRGCERPARRPVRAERRRTGHDGAALSMLARGADPGDLVGASMVVTYVHDRGPLVLPGSDRVYEPTGRDLVLDVSDAVRIDSDGMITERWSGLSFARLHWQLEQNATL